MKALALDGASPEAILDDLEARMAQMTPDKAESSEAEGDDANPLG